MMWRYMMVLSVLMPVMAYAVEIEGVHLAERVTVADQELQLNGAGIRSKFFFDIYIGALYLPRQTHSARQAIAMAGNKRVLMHILYHEVSKDKMSHGWTTGFEHNSHEQMDKLQARLSRFNTFFPDLKEGDEVVLDLLESGKTVVYINQVQAGDIQGNDFQQALLAVWLGTKPADDDLKEAMLGG